MNTKYFAAVNRTEQKDDVNPLDISEILSICKEYSNLGLNIQSQIEYLLENGLEASIKSGVINTRHIPFIKAFLSNIKDNFYFGDASDQASDIIDEISKISVEQSNTKVQYN
jgi:hypothetical protein